MDNFYSWQYWSLVILGSVRSNTIIKTNTGIGYKLHYFFITTVFQQLNSFNLFTEVIWPFSKVIQTSTDSFKLPNISLVIQPCTQIIWPFTETTGPFKQLTGLADIMP